MDLAVFTCTHTLSNIGCKIIKFAHKTTIDIVKQEHCRAGANARLWVQFLIKINKKMTFDLEGWPWPFTTQNVQLHEMHMHFYFFYLEGWPWPFTTQNVQLHEIHMHAKYQVAIFNIAKVMTNVKVFGRTHRQTDGQSKFLRVWKGLVHIHMHTKYEGYISRDIEVMSIFQNLNADFET